MSQYYATTGRKEKRRYDKSISESAPTAMEQYYNQEALNLSEEEIKSSAENYNDLIEAETQAANEATGISAANLALTAYNAWPSGGSETGAVLSSTPSAISTGVPAATDLSKIAPYEDYLFAEGTTTAPVVAGEAASSGSAANYIGGETLAGAESGSTAGTSLGTLGAIAAIIAAQQVAAENVEGEYEGQPFRSKLNFNEEGYYEPGIFETAPIMDWAGQVGGVYDADEGNVSAGWKADAALYNEDWGSLASELAGETAYYGIDPAGSFGYDAAKSFLSNQWGFDDTAAQIGATLINPVGGIADAITDFLDSIF